jgi:hypothetical protein
MTKKKTKIISWRDNSQKKTISEQAARHGFVGTKAYIEAIIEQVEADPSLYKQK